MTAYSHHHTSGPNGSSTPARPSVTPPHATLSSAQISEWRSQINALQHPVIVLNAAFQPILLNDALRAQLSDPATAPGTDQPVAFLWQSVCETVTRIAAEQAKHGRSTQIAEAFPLHQRCYVAVGTLLRNLSGQVHGAVISLGDLTESKDRLQSVFSGQDAASDTPSTEPVDEDTQRSFQEWQTQREEARRKISRLSRRETQVVGLVSDGLPNKSIAHELDISVKTIEKHRANATRKLGVGSTAEMVRIVVVAHDKPAVVDGNSGLSADQTSR